MDMHYYFTPMFIDAILDVKAPGTSDSGTLTYAEMPVHCRALEYDMNLDRVVVEAPASWTPPSDWSQVDTNLIEMDYPGLLGA